jgi:hypothetical protein
VNVVEIYPGLFIGSETDYERRDDKKPGGGLFTPARNPIIDRR